SITYINFDLNQSTTVTMKKKPVRKSNPILKLARGLRVSDCEIQIRPSDKECSPAPRYSSTSKFFTVTLEFGGKFDIGKKYSAYLGGSTIMFDYVDYERVTLADFKSVAEFKGCKNPMRLHTYVGCGSFMLLSTETDLESVWQRQFNKVREVSLFVEELSENTEIVNAPEIENEVGEDDSDETFEWENDSEVDKLDDILFDENVDEVEVEVGVEAEEGEVEGEGEKGEGEKGEGEGENGEGEGETDSDETFEWENDSEVDKLDDILFDENVDEVEVEVGVEAEEGEVEGEGEKGEGEKGEGEGENGEGEGETDSDETFEWENDSEVDKLDDILFDENVDEVEVEVGVEAEEGEVEGEGEKGEGEKGEGEGETELGVEKGELGVEIEAEKVDEGEESDEDLNQVVDEVAEFMAKNGGFDADGGVGGESEESEDSEDSEESDDDILDWEYDMEADKVDDKMFDDNVDFDAEWLHGQGEGVKKCANDGLKCTVCHVEGHNKRGCLLMKEGNADPAAIGLEDRPQKLKARRMTDKAPAIGVSTQESVVTGEGQAHKKRKEGKKQTTVPKFIQAPSMYNQYTSAQLGPTSGVNIRGPPTFQVGQFIPSQESCLSERDTRLKQIFQEGGQKYISVSELISGMNNPKKSDDGRGKQKLL
ncbi:midasin, partial [Striga asiatica]